MRGGREERRSSKLAGLDVCFALTRLAQQVPLGLCQDSGGDGTDYERPLPRQLHFRDGFARLEPQLLADQPEGEGEVLSWDVIPFIHLLSTSQRGKGGIILSLRVFATYIFALSPLNIVHV